MIFGTISFSEKAPSSVTDRLSEGNDNGILLYCPVIRDNFHGGYYRNSLLPWTDADFCHNDEANDVFVMMSGAVYNREELCRSHHISDSVTDPELTAKLFLNEGPEFVRHLNGDFVILILLSGKEEAFLYRDHLGIRPIAYYTDCKSLAFSNDIIGLCRVVAPGRAIDSDYLTGHFRYIDYRKTPCAGVQKVLPGEYLHITAGGVQAERYWHPERIRTDKSLTHDRMLTDLKALLEDAVRIRSDRRFMAGAHVSSGLDSGVVSVMARKEYGSQVPFCGFSWSPEGYSPIEVEYDERDLVRDLCRVADIIPVFSDLDRETFPGSVASFYNNQGFFSEERTVTQAVKTGTNLIFSGWGGDEFVSTAAPSIETDLLRSLKLGLYLRRNQVGKPPKLIRNFVHYVLMPALGIHERGTARSFRDEGRYLKKRFRKSDRRAIRQFYFHTSRRGHHLGMLSFYHLQDRCEKLFVMGYRHGVDYRYPLLDRRIIEFMLTVPSELLCKTDYFRPLLREISVGMIPEEIRLNQSKRDPVYSEYMDEIWEDAATGFMEQVDQWKGNSDLNFIDFELLKHDMQMYKDGVPAVKGRVLFRALIYIKAVHEFSMSYHEMKLN